eukprot:CAMPEP_0185168844 /NCGR_PEP_ID=MMETSP1139-20130426/16461_1 /TAXON_ID=298111 /ORGANISM="Pavlova sp., Strain CCMP459" /LENGTH=36 /DNA_ID= /DNA_START= /DNA_END= /DNA_ORIENTATION=
MASALRSSVMSGATSWLSSGFGELKYRERSSTVSAA